MPFDMSPEDVETVTKPATPEHFEMWLAAKPRDETYEWHGRCLYYQYGEYCGLGRDGSPYLEVIAAIMAHTNQAHGGEPFRFVASEYPHTFGAALRRLRTQRHGFIGAAKIYFLEWLTARALLAKP